MLSRVCRTSFLLMVPSCTRRVREKEETKTSLADIFIEKRGTKHVVGHVCVRAFISLCPRGMCVCVV